MTKSQTVAAGLLCVVTLFSHVVSTAASDLADISADKTSRGVQGVLVIPKAVDSFDGRALEVKLWEYDPRLADAAATLIDKFGIKKFKHTTGKETKTKFVVGSKVEPRSDRKYYMTLFVLKDGKRTHIGEIDGKRGLGKVTLTKNKPTAVKLIGRSVN